MNRCALVIISHLLLMPVANAQQDQTTPEQLEAVESEQLLTSERLEELKAEVAATLAEEAELSIKLKTAADRYETQQSLLARSEDTLKTLKEEEILIRSDLAARREVLAEVLAGLQRLEQNPPPALVVKPGDVLGALRGAMLFGAIVPEMKDEAIAVTRKLERLNAVVAETDVVRERATTELINLETTQSDLNQLIQEKLKARKIIEKSLAETLAQSEALAAKAQDLKQLLAAIAEEKNREENRLSSQAAAEARARDDETKKREAQRNPALKMVDAKGKLDYPVDGKIVRQFGEDNGFGSPMVGMAIVTAKKALVRSPVDGTVEFAGRFRSFGQMVIINAGQEYLILVAGLTEISSVAGQTIRRGDPLGIMGEAHASVAMLDTSAGTGIEGENPLLYIEFRHNGLAVDSRPFWAGYKKEAQE
jgi:murein hydrolase activator